jgi:predicted transcriptional regulator
MIKDGKFRSLVVATAILSSVSLMGSNEIMEPTGLDQIHEIIDTDERIARKVSQEDIDKAQTSVTEMNRLIKEAVRTLGLANDGWISIADTREINIYLVEKYGDTWGGLREDYTTIEKKSETLALNKNAVKNLWGKIYNLGFEPTQENKKLTDINGKKSSSFTTVGYYLGEVMKSDVTGLNNPDFQEIEGTTGTKLDMIVQVILSDRGLLRKIPTSDLRAGSKNANEMNHLIIEAIKAEGLGNDGKLTTADIRTINEYLVTNHLTEWAVLHGDDEDGEETGFHRVQNDGATTRMYAANVMNSIADGIYHLGFKTDQKNRLVNEDGNKNKSFEKIAWWLDTSLKSDLSTGILSNPSYQEVVGETGTSLDKMIPYIYNNEGLLRKVSMSDIREGARTANEMNKLLVQAIRTTGVANDDYISVDDARTLNEYLVANNATEWATLHGDDEDNEETGYHRIQNDGATGTMHNRNTINNLADGIYHLGFESYDDKRLANEDGNKNVSFRNVSYWLNQSLKSDYASGVFK